MRSQYFFTQLVHHHTLGLISEAIEQRSWAIEDWILLTVLVIEGVLLAWLMRRLVGKVFSSRVS